MGLQRVSHNGSNLAYTAHIKVVSFFLIEINKETKLSWIEQQTQNLLSSLFSPLDPWHSKFGPKTDSIGITWEMVRNTESQAPSNTYLIRICISTRYRPPSQVIDMHVKDWDSQLQNIALRTLIFVMTKLPKMLVCILAGSSSHPTWISAQCYSTSHLVPMSSRVAHVL